ncbi:MAG: hypothetical protein CVU56_11870 [Deltaproteobacteria bacterium HGW-Deltaproteobacteria-14]|nr:MAG: hypothetical protein CVU56_11870 [Deltaproteobacteria bacterium HGW-Deltaproteobacteria-14]
MRRWFAHGAGPVLVALLCGPFGGPAHAGEADLDGPRAARDFVAVGADAVSSVTASSAIADCPPQSVLDGKVGVPWISRSDDREGASLTLRFGHVHWLDHVDVVVGHGRDNVSFHAFGRPTSLELVFSDGRRERYPMKDTRRAQRITFMSLAVTDSLTLILHDVDGPDGAGVALSEVTAYEPRDVFEVDPAFRARISEFMMLFDDPARHAEGVALIDRFGRHATPYLLRRVMEPDGKNRRLALSLILRNDRVAARRAVGQLLASDAVDDVLLALGQLSEAPDLDEHGAVARLVREDPRLLVRRAAFFALAARPPSAGWRELLETVAADPAPGFRAVALREMERIEAPWAERALLRTIEQGPSEDARLALELLVASPLRDFGPVERTLRGLPVARLATLLPVIGATVRPETTALLVELLASETDHVLYRPLHDACDAHGRAGLGALLARIEARGEVSLTVTDFLLARAPAAAELAGPVLARVVTVPEHDDVVQTLIEVVGRAHASGARDAVVRAFTDPERPVRVRDAALLCLGQLAPTAYTEALVRGQVHAERTAFRSSAYRAAIAMRLTDVVPEVRRHLGTLPPRLWDPLAVEVVAELGGADDLAFLIDRYIDANRVSQVVILQGAYRSGSTPGVRLLIDAAAGRDRTLRRYAERHLAEAKPK